VANSRTGRSYSGGDLDYGPIRRRLEAGDRGRVGSGFDYDFEVALAVHITPRIVRNPGSLGEFSWPSAGAWRTTVSATVIEDARGLPAGPRRDMPRQTPRRGAEVALFIEGGAHK
jgi:hypothetical protein